MLQDPSVERMINSAMKPVLKQIKELKAEVELLKQALHKTDVVGQSEQCVLHSTDWNGKCFKCGEQVFVREPK